MDVGERVAKIEERQSDFDRWQIQQNGRLDKMDAKLSNIQHWLMAVMGGLIVSLVLLIVQMAMSG